MTSAYALLFAGLLPVLCIGPGFFLVRRLRWGSSEKLCASIGVSIFLIYLVSTSIYLSKISWKWCWLATAAGIFLTLLCWRDLLGFLRRRSIRRQLSGFALLLGAGLLMLCLIQHYSGGEWAGDWLEHYQRAVFFLNRQPPETKFIQRYVLPARPPMMNLVASYFLAHTATRYDLFQLVFLFLNLLVLFPCILLANHLVKYGSRRVWLIASFLALSPVVMENATWTWTKLLTAFYVILSLAFYLRAWQKNDATKMIAAIASLSAALLVHYSAGPYAIALFLHYLLILPSRRRILPEVGGAFGIVTVVLATWFIWALVMYGPRTTFASNTTATDTRGLSLSENLTKLGGNFSDTFLPHPLRVRHNDFSFRFDQPNPYGFVRDFFFLIYQTTLTFAWGLIGWIALTWLMFKQLSRARAAQRWFWTIFIFFGVGIGIAVVGSRERFGVAHACLQPFGLVGLTLLAAGLPRLPRWAGCTLVVFMGIDLLLGIILHSRMEMHAFRLLPTAEDPMVPFSNGLLSLPAIQNSALRFNVKTTYWGDHFAQINWLVFIIFVLLMGLTLFIAANVRGKAFASVVAVLFCAGTAICASDRIAGYDSISFRQPDTAARIAPLIQATQASPYVTSNYYALGRAHYELGQLQLAGNAFFTAFLLDPTYREARYAVVLCLVTHGIEPDGTEAGVVEYFRKHPDDLEAHLALVHLLDAAKFPLPALQRLRDAMIKFPQSPQIQDLKTQNLTLEIVEQRIRLLQGGR